MNLWSFSGVAHVQLRAAKLPFVEQGERGCPVPLWPPAERARPLVPPRSSRPPSSILALGADRTGPEKSFLPALQFPRTPLQLLPSSEAGRCSEPLSAQVSCWASLPTPGPCEASSGQGRVQEAGLQGSELDSLRKSHHRDLEPFLSC